jgi:rod shape-determining protein MreC
MKLRRYFLIIAIVITLVVFFHAIGWPFFIGKIFIPLQPLFSGFDKKLNQPSEIFSSKKLLLEENEKLSTEITRLITENIKLKMIEEENEKLRKELDFVKKENYKLTLTNIIGKKEEAGVIWFIVDRGSRDKIKEGYMAISEGVVVGKIVKALENISYLLPLYDERVKLAVEIVEPHEKTANKAKIMGIAKGKSGLTVEIDLVPTDKKINDEDLVLTSGLEYTTPKGFLVGTLKNVESKPSDPFYKAIVETPIKLDSLEIVNIIIPQSE